VYTTTDRYAKKVQGSGVHTGMKRKTGYMLKCVAMAHPKPANGIFPVTHQINNLSIRAHILK
jgi:hypothetical protein